MYSGRALQWCVFLLIIVAVVPAIALGAGIPEKIVPCDGTSINGGTECTVCMIATLMQNILNTGIFLAVFLAAILFAWAGVRMLTNQGNPGQVTEAKKIFWNVTVGLVGILAAWLLVDTIMFTFMGNHLWSKLC
jgi:hypothetical protein